uniref:CBM20 domain-containing protein n=1 Tax=Chromera velia CCMP2878 TaxID=1169474 RepID=A0A0G4GGX2_9ALVE|eukprot:Cvel_21783.t1-p1 / transcript=Cvel_21783.t1 / gene=Cvel_21783 / organism=Chromera_velia_CCMP2878 / gene_product=hypothetical protein / transcript_product=hypothetical protein / location=Cvel_scaffold2074:1921-3234(-) / protein_length=438 / sequence_SO=supercontig / SO=protein_coding / is_pseudo=false
MIEAETGVVLFACSSVEPREGQTLVVVGSSSELGGWDASRGITLHRVKNPAFPGVWMSFPMCHSACSEVRFQFALVGPVADTESLQSMTFENGGLVVDGVRTSSAVSSAVSAAPVDGRNQDCCGCVWGEPLGCGPREVEVVDGGFVLFGGRWGEGGTQVTPLALKDMVLAQQQLDIEHDTFPSVSSEFNTERNGKGERGEMRREGNFGVPAAGDLMVDETSPSAASVVRSVSSPFPSCVSSERVGGKGKQRGHCDEVSASRSKETEGRGGRDGDGEGSVGGEFCVATVVGTQKEGPAWERAGVLSLSTEGKSDEGESGLAGGGAAVFDRGLVVGQRQAVSRELSPEGHDAPVCAVREGPKRRRLSSLSVAVSESHLDGRGGKEAFILDRTLSVPSPPQQHFPVQNDSLPPCFRMRNTGVHSEERQSANTNVLAFSCSE